MAAAKRSRNCQAVRPAAIRSTDWFGDLMSICAAFRHSSVFRWTLAAGKRLRVPHKGPEVPNGNLISAPCMLRKVIDKILVVVKHHCVRCPSTSEKLVLDQNRAVLFEHLLNGSELLG